MKYALLIISLWVAQISATLAHAAPVVDSTGKQHPYRSALAGFNEPEVSEVIVVGDVHGATYWNQEDALGTFNRFVGSLSKPGDIVLYEGSPFGSNPEDVRWDFGFGAPKDLIFDGWDTDPRFHKQKRSLSLRLQRTATGLTWDDRILDAGLHSALHQVVIEDRNQILASSVMKSRERHPGKRVFVFVGIGHLDDPGLIEFFRRQGFRTAFLVNVGAENQLTTLKSNLCRTMGALVANLSKADAARVLEAVEAQKNVELSGFWERLGVMIPSYEQIQSASSLNQATSSPTATCERFFLSLSLN